MRNRNHLTKTNEIGNRKQYTSGLPVVYDSDVTRPVNNRLHTGKEYLSFEGLHWYDNHARMYDPLLMRFFIQFVKYYIK